jgi:hypothetical protein
MNYRGLTTMWLNRRLHHPNRVADFPGGARRVLLVLLMADGNEGFWVFWEGLGE